MTSRRFIGLSLPAFAAACALGAGTASASSVATEPAAQLSSRPGEPAIGQARLPAGGGNVAAARIALRHLGTPYVWGGASPGGFDCSGLASYAYGQIGKSVPHYTVAIWSAFPKVAADRLQVGDMVFFHDLGHMGIYLGADLFVHAPHTGDVVKVSRLSTYSGYVGAVRA